LTATSTDQVQVRVKDKGQKQIKDKNKEQIIEQQIAIAIHADDWEDDSSPSIIVIAFDGCLPV
jgi:hypothetical protein